ncbi:MAG: CDP-diacylglycerol--glycerol-3-phosphate 3-phosphatidyltransferase [Pseudomonadota bacterium]|nr:CDP-diacylglycerol--glycerol-3-phosphate 3-phosphatidyltransferase [Pseudomonadota bacterium]HJO35913.1 CDP-diacylglycerol--glycerol-3-phosphate 3-phosphatidyltransferase [Gammaproteobacteria bacterium]
MNHSLPNWLTLARLFMIPLVLGCYYLPVLGGPGAAAAIFLLASVTDLVDGYLARRWQQTTAFGAFLDPVADKLLVTFALIVVLQQDPRLLVALPAAVIIAREIVVSALREWMAEAGHRGRVAVSQWGKVKTLVQMAALALLLLGAQHSPLEYRLGLAALWVAAALTLWSMLLYLMGAWSVLSGGPAARSPGGAKVDDA